MHRRKDEAPSPKRRRLSTREGAIVTSFALPRALHRRLMLAALQLNWTFAELLREAAEEWLTKHKPDVGKGNR